MALPLIHFRGSTMGSECCICGETITEVSFSRPYIFVQLFKLLYFQVVVDLGCHHSICLACFVAYMNTTFRQQQFILRPPYGYTLSCPIYNCNGTKKPFLINTLLWSYYLTITFIYFCLLLVD